MRNWKISGKRSVLAAALLLPLVAAIGCESSPEMLTNSELDSLNKIRTGKYALIDNEELSKLRQDAEIGKSVGRYRVDREGLRTWRLDTATGQTCILLTSDEDWKKPGIAAQGCGAQ